MFPLDAGIAASDEPETVIKVPGARAAPFRGLKMWSDPFGFSTGAELGLTELVSCDVTEPEPLAVAVAEMLTCVDVLRGVQVPVYSAVFGSASGIGSGGSPFENVAVICPLGTASPQSLSRRTLMGVGQDAGAEKLVTTPVCAIASRPGMQALA